MKKKKKLKDELLRRLKPISDKNELTTSTNNNNNNNDDDDDDVAKKFTEIGTGLYGISLALLGNPEYLSWEHFNPVIADEQREFPIYRKTNPTKNNKKKKFNNLFSLNYPLIATHSERITKAAVNAVVRCNGKYGLEMALSFYKHAYWETQEIAIQLKTMLKKNNCPGSEILDEEPVLPTPEEKKIINNNKNNDNDEENIEDEKI